MCSAYVRRVLEERQNERPGPTTDRKNIVVVEKQVSTDPSPGPMPRGWQARILEAGVERALRTQQPLVAARVAAIRRKRPQASPAEVIDLLGRGLKIAVIATGGVGGAIAVVPAIGTIASLATASAEALAALDATVLYALAVAEVHALPTETAERRRALVLGVIMGEGGQATLRKVTGKSGDWAQDITNVLPLSKLGPLNITLTRWFIKRFVIRQSVLALGRALPLGIGLVVGAVGNFVIARAVIRGAERAFGPPPTRWPDATPSNPLPTAAERQPSIEA
jgi:hypothetical protein